MSDDRSYRKALPTPQKGRYHVRIIVKDSDGSLIQADLADSDPVKVHATLGELMPSVFGKVTP